jgi:hypothetical protein
MATSDTLVFRMVVYASVFQQLMRRRRAQHAFATRLVKEQMKKPVVDARVQLNRSLESNLLIPAIKISSRIIGKRQMFLTLAKKWTTAIVIELILIKLP